MQSLALPFLIYYLAVVAVVCVYGLHRYWMVWAFLRSRRARESGIACARIHPLPPVTVQLPMFNERRVAERIIEAACAIDYPRDRLHIQVLDDSTDASVAIAEACCERLRAAGHNVEYVHRTNVKASRQARWRRVWKRLQASLSRFSTLTLFPLQASCTTRSITLPTLPSAWFRRAGRTSIATILC